MQAGKAPPGPRPLQRRRLVWAGLGVFAVVHALIAWFPFRLDPPVRVAVEVAHDGDAVVLAGQRVVAEADPPWTGIDVRGIEVVTVDLEIRAAEPMQFGPARILTVSDGYADANLMIGQERDNLVVRVRRVGSDAAGNPPVVVPHAFSDAGTWTRVTVAVRRDLVEVEVDGLPTRRLQVDRTPMRTWDPSYPLLLGDERPGGRVWHGEIRRAVVTADGEGRDYLVPGALDVPDRVWYVPARLRESLTRPDPRAQLRAAAHLVAFVPGGMLLVAARRRPGAAGGRLWRAVAAAGGFAVVLQLGKVALEGRHPSLLTVLTQCGGALAGAAVALRVLRGRDGPAA